MCRKSKFATAWSVGTAYLQLAGSRSGAVVYVMGGYVFTRQSSKVADPGSLFQHSEIQIAGGKWNVHRESGW